MSSKQKSSKPGCKGVSRANSTAGFKYSMIVAAVAATFGWLPDVSLAAGKHVEGPYPIVSDSSVDLSTPPVVAANARGQYVVGWQPNLASKKEFGPAMVEVLSSPATPVSAAIPIGTQVFGNVAVAIDKDGDFVVAWRDGTLVKAPDWHKYGAPYPASTGTVYIQRYSASGVAQGSPITVAPYTNGLTRWQGAPPIDWYAYANVLAPLEVAMDDDGDVTVGWTQTSEYATYFFYTGCYSSSESVTYTEVFSANGTVTQPLTAVDLVDSGGEVSKFDELLPVDADILAGISMDGGPTVGLVYNRYRKTVKESPQASIFNSYWSSGPYGATFTLDADTSNHVAPGMFGMDGAGQLAAGWISGGALNFAQYVSDGEQYGSGSVPLAHQSPQCASALPVSSPGAMAITWGALRKVDLFGTGTPQPSCERYVQFISPSGVATGPQIVIDSGNNQLNGPDLAAAVGGSGTFITVWSATQSDHSTGLEAAVVNLN